MQIPAKISVLVSARKNSKYLSKFLFGYFENTHDQINTEILVMMNEHDTWNKDLVGYFTDQEDIQFLYEDYNYGRDGLHVYFNDLLKHADGDWIIYFCEDHYINTKFWDSYVRQVINGGSRSMKGETSKSDKSLDPKYPYCLVPKFDNAGAMNHILSRGYIETLNGVLGRHGWIDSYINDVNALAFGIQSERPNNKPGDTIIKFDDEMFHDFTHDDPNPMSDAHLQSIKGKIKLPDYKDSNVKDMIKRDAERLRGVCSELQE